MMQANEIRIGNWIYYNGKLSKIDLTDFRDILEDNYEINYYKPILLTEEILLKCGFELINNEFYRSRDHELNLFWTANKNKMIPEYAEKRLVTGCDFKHLHQLQNLYFALTGKELTYNSIV